MGALLAIGMFVLFVGLDWLLHRSDQESEAALAPAFLADVPAVDPDPVWIGGYELPEHLHYHPGHVWVRPLGADTVTVGMDDFARKLVGKVKSLSLPRAGSWLLQGSKAFHVDNGTHAAELACPVEGEVLEVNPALRGKPGARDHGSLRPRLAVQDPGAAPRRQPQKPSPRNPRAPVD